MKLLEDPLTMVGESFPWAGIARFLNGLKPVWGPCLLALMVLHSSSACVGAAPAAPGWFLKGFFFAQGCCLRA
jgi:hypothetical protein